MPGGGDAGLRAAVRVRVPLREGRPRGPALGRRAGLDFGARPGPALLGHPGGGRPGPGPVGGDGPGPRGGLEVGAVLRPAGGDVVGVPRPGVVTGGHQRRVRHVDRVGGRSRDRTGVGVGGIGRAGERGRNRSSDAGGGGGAGGIPPRPSATGVLGARDGVVPAQGLLRRAGREARQHDAPVLTHQHRPDGDVPVRPAVRVQHPQRGQHVRRHLGGPVGAQRFIGYQRGQRPGRDQFAHYPQRLALGEHVEDLVQPGMVRDRSRRLCRLDGAAHGRQIGGRAARRRDGPRPVQQLRVHDFR